MWLCALYAHVMLEILCYWYIISEWGLCVCVFAAVSTSDANLSAIGPVLLSAMQKVVSDTNNVSISVSAVFTTTIFVVIVCHCVHVRIWHLLLFYTTLSGVLACLSVWSEMQMLCMWSSWCHCHSIISRSSKIQNGLPLWCRLMQVVLEKKADKWM